MRLSLLLIVCVALCSSDIAHAGPTTTATGGVSGVSSLNSTADPSGGADATSSSARTESPATTTTTTTTSSTTATPPPMPAPEIETTYGDLMIRTTGRNRTIAVSADNVHLHGSVTLYPTPLHGDSETVENNQNARDLYADLTRLDQLELDLPRAVQGAEDARAELESELAAAIAQAAQEAAMATASVSTAVDNLAAATTDSLQDLERALTDDIGELRTYVDGPVLDAATRCHHDEYETSAFGGPASPRTCLPLRVCGSDEYVTKAPTRTSNRECSGHTACGDDEYEASPATDTKPRVCVKYTECEADEYEVVEPTYFTDRVCIKATPCPDHTHEVTPPSQTANRICRHNRQCSTLEYESEGPTATTDRTCAPLTQCAAFTSAESVPPTPTSDRVCALCGEVETYTDPFSSAAGLDTEKQQGTVIVAEGEVTLGGAGGSGKDGDRRVTNGKNLHSETISGRGAPDAAAYMVTGITGARVTVSEAASGLAPGDEAVVHVAQTSGSLPSDAGLYEFCRVESVSGSEVTCVNPFSSVLDAVNVNDRRITLQRVPNYNSLEVTSSGLLTGNGWDGRRYGLLVIRARTMKISGAIDMNARGYRGAPRTRLLASWGLGFRGECPACFTTATLWSSRSPDQYFGGGGGGAAEWCCAGLGGGGGAHNGNGGNGDCCRCECGGEWSGGRRAASGGIGYGSPELTRLFYGSGGGSGGVDGDNPDDGGGGGAGGGAIILLANQIIIDGVVRARGRDGLEPIEETGGGAGGAGGSILIYALQATVNKNVEVQGGNPNGWGAGMGASGRAALYAPSSSGNGLDSFHHRTTAHLEPARISLGDTVVSKNLMASVEGKVCRLSTLDIKLDAESAVVTGDISGNGKDWILIRHLLPGGLKHGDNVVPLVMLDLPGDSLYYRLSAAGGPAKILEVSVEYSTI